MDATATTPVSGPDTPPRRRPDRRGVVVVSVLAVAYVAQVALRLWLVRDVTALTVRIDEDNYLVAARVLAGGPGGITSENSLFRRIGYPLMISPVYWFTSDPLTAYKGVLGINAVLNAATLVPAYLFLRRVLSAARPLAAAVAITVTTLPAVVFYGQVAMTDAVLPMAVLWWLLAVHAALGAAPGRARWRWAAVSGLAAGGLWLIHVRSLVILLVEVVLMLILAWRDRAWRRPAVAAAGGIAVTLAFELAIRILIRGEIVVTGGNPAGTLGDRITSPAGWLHTAAWAIGQLWYQGVATLGLAAVGVVAVLGWLRRRAPEHRTRDLTLLVLLATTVGIALMSAATLPDDQRINLYAYARYLAFLAPAWFAVGVVALVCAPRATRVRLVGVELASLVAGAVVVLAYATRLTSDAYIAFDSPELGVLTNTWDDVPVVAGTLVGAAALVALAALIAGGRLRYVALGLVVVGSAVAMPVIDDHATEPMAREFAATTTLAEVGITPADTVAESYNVTWWAQANHQWEVYWDAIARFDEATQEPAAEATVVIAPYESPNRMPTWDGTRYGWRLVARDTEQGWAVWRR